MKPIELAFAVVSEANARDSRRKKAARVASQRQSTFLVLRAVFFAKPLPALPLRVLFTRYYGGADRPYDDDNLASAFKAARDEVAKYFGVNDKHQNKIRFEYEQQRTERPLSYATVCITSEKDHELVRKTSTA